MIMDLNSDPSSPPVVPSKYDDQNQELHPFVLDNQVSSSSCVFFDMIQDQTVCYQHQLCPHQHHQDRNYAYNGGSSTKLEVKWINEDPRDVLPDIKWKNDANPVKLMSAKMRLMQKMKKNHDGLGLNLTSYCTAKKSSHLGTDSSSSISSHDNIPIRVCSDCNTTKTPLWRSGPEGPKSLCNACGIKQRKARQAAASASKSAVVDADKPKIKMQHEEKATGENQKASRLMERGKMEQRSGSKSIIGQKELGNFEDLLMKLSKNLTFHREFPEDEMDAAILLMALSSGLLHR